ncbi:MAG: peptidoglycan DD-metalloendopeptidase family protein [Cyanobacteriota bacterium]|nr:peptidoglycan DD-metalloendopeptidase family protein [Cyanobacteriota bacterium]
MKPFRNLQSPSWSNFLKEMFENSYGNANETLKSKAPQQGTGISLNAARNVTPTQSVKTLVGKKIILDPGHGITNTGFDPGAVANSTTEAAENLHQANLIANHLRQLGAEVNVLDEPLSLAQIGQRAAGHDIFVSLHQNAFNNNAQGHEVYSHPSAPAKDAQLAQAINSELDAIFPDSIIPDRGTKKANFSVLRNAPTDVPAVLVESLFMDAPGMSRANVEKAGTAVGRGIEKFFTGKVTGSTPPPSNPTTPQPTPSSTSGVVNSKVGSLPLNLRSGSFVGAGILGKLPKGTSFKILKSVTGGTYNPGTGSRNDWYEIEVNGKTGYVAAYYVDLKSSSEPKPTSFNLKPEGTNLDFRRGQEWITSTGYKFRFQTDGNLVLYSPQGKAIWATGTENTNADLFAVQRDGNVVLYDRGKPVWATDTGGNPGATFAIQGDGNLVVYSSNGKALFATGTDGGRIKTRSASSDWLNKGQASSSKPGYVDSSIGLNFRTSPSLSGSRISRLANGTNLTILQKVSGGYYDGRNDWYKVKVGNTTGYVAAAYVKEGNKTIAGLKFSTVTSKATGKALDAGGQNNSVYPHPSPSSGNEFHLWGFEKVGDYYMMIDKATGKALDAGGDGGKLPYIHPNPNKDNPYHLWKITKVGDAYLVVNKATGRALDSGGANGNHIYMYPTPISGNSFHLWKLNLPDSGSGGNDAWQNPLDPGTYTIYSDSRYRTRQRPNHHGIDLSTWHSNPYVPVKAAKPGQVIEVGYHPDGWGRFIRIQHTDGLRTVYAHLSRTDVRVGNHVNGGQKIGNVGSTGWSTGPHLHLEVHVAPYRHPQDTRNPEDYIRF